MNFQWREGVYDQCALYAELIRDDGKVLGCIMRFYEVNCARYAMTETKRLGPNMLRVGQWKRPYLKGAKPTLILARRPSAIDKSAGDLNDGHCRHHLEAE